MRSLNRPLCVFLESSRTSFFSFSPPNGLTRVSQIDKEGTFSSWKHYIVWSTILQNFEEKNPRSVIIEIFAEFSRIRLFISTSFVNHVGLS